MKFQIKFLLFLILTINLFAEELPEFGEISMEELKMTNCAEEPDADAVILLDKCDMRITNDFRLITNYHRRVKILTEEGKDYADIEIRYYHKNDISGLDAICYSTDGEEYELDSDDIVETESGNMIELNFSIPGVKVGSVIEYEFRISSDYITRLDPWYFQDKNFTKISQLKVLLPTGFNYQKVELNTADYNITQVAEQGIDPDNPTKKITQYIWTGRNIPGLKEEPHVYNLDDKFAKYQFILNSYKDRWQYFKYAKTWKEIGKRVDEIFKFWDDGGDTEDKALEIVGTETDDLAKAKLIYNFVREKIKQTKHKFIWGSSFKKPEEVLTAMEGTTSEKNLLLINMLNHAGLRAERLFISTRTHGEIVPNFCEYGQFNRMICRLVIKKKSYFLNAGFKANPFGLLTPNYTVSKGYLVTEDNASIISLKPKRAFNKLSYVTSGSINIDRSISAKTEITYKGEFAFNKRNYLEDKIDSDIKENVEDFLDGLYEGSELDTFYYTGVSEIEDDLLLNLEYTLPDYIEESDDLVYFAFPLFSAIKENPFKRDKRFYSIDYHNSGMVTEEIKLSIPENYKLIETPKNSRAGIKNLSYTRSLFSGKNYIKCKRLKNLKSKQIHHNSYQKLKLLYETMISADEEQLVFSKTTESASNKNSSEGK